MTFSCTLATCSYNAHAQTNFAVASILKVPFHSCVVFVFKLPFDRKRRVDVQATTQTKVDIEATTKTKVDIKATTKTHDRIHKRCMHSKGNRLVRGTRGPVAPGTDVPWNLSPASDLLKNPLYFTHTQMLYQ